MRRGCLIGVIMICLIGEIGQAAEPSHTKFNASDGLEVHANLYVSHGDEAPFIVLFHQARWSRGEYREIAPKLLALGYNCMAVDQRSGGEVNEVRNLTAAPKDPTYLDALPDMEAAVHHAREHYAKGKLVIWGSSYSAALAFVVAAEHAGQVDGVVSFSPGEDFSRFGKSKTYIADAAKSVDAPTFISSAKTEVPKWEPIWNALAAAEKERYIPKIEGRHGSRALWAQMEGHEAVWGALTAFLRRHFPPQATPEPA